MREAPHRVLPAETAPGRISVMSRSLQRGTSAGLWSAWQVEAFADPQASRARRGEQQRPERGFARVRWDDAGAYVPAPKGQDSVWP